MTKKTFLTIIALAIAGIAILGYYQYQKRASDLTDVARETITNKDLALSFRYPAGERAFSVIESSSPEEKLLKGYVLVPTKEYDEYTKSTEAREGPISISVLVYQLDEAPETGTSGEQLDRVTRLQNWAIDNNTLTSFKVAKNPPEIVEIDGVKAFHYQADGLYQQDIYIASYKRRVYMFASSYNSELDITKTSFEELIKSVAFD
ncbi:MAG: hypothetical protein RLZZ480_308 [Candidatus Parcubacteria bacterium]